MIKKKTFSTVKQLTSFSAGVHTLADCPWPPSDSQCSPCLIWWPDDKNVGFNIWGEYGGDSTRERMHAQPFCVTNSSLKNMTFKVARLRETAVPTNHGMVVCIASADALDFEPKFSGGGITQNFLDQMEWYGYIATVSGGAPTTHYYVCADVNLSLDTSKTWYLLFLTNGSYEVCGWQMSGIGASGLPDGVQPLFEYNLNEPGNPNGWGLVDNYFRGTVMPYQSGSEALDEGFCQIVNPNFPGTATAGTTYTASFDVDQLTAFPCGCPETIVSVILNRDTSTPLGSEQSFLLDCGYNGANGWPVQINFDGGGTFHGQLQVGHKTSETEWQSDDFHDFDIVVTALPCSSHSDATACINGGCYWWNNSCHDAQPTACSQLNNQTDCSTYGCYWYGGTCHSEPEPQTDLCSYIQDKGGPTGLVIVDVFEIVDALLFQTPPTGYTFIPSIQNVFGVIDYYLGFDGDGATGCNFF